MFSIIDWLVGKLHRATRRAYEVYLVSHDFGYEYKVRVYWLHSKAAQREIVAKLHAIKGIKGAGVMSHPESTDIEAEYYVMLPFDTNAPVAYASIEQQIHTIIVDVLRDELAMPTRR